MGRDIFVSQFGSHRCKYKFHGRVFGVNLGWRCIFCDDGRLKDLVEFYSSMLGIEVRRVDRLDETPPLV